jgi:uncharacterized protein (TIGR03067 family)
VVVLVGLAGLGCARKGTGPPVITVADVPVEGDLARMQGVWLFDDFENGAKQKLDPEQLRGMRAEFRGPVLVIVRPGPGRNTYHRVVAVAPDKAPKEIDLMDCDEQGRVRPHHVPGKGDRPTTWVPPKPQPGLYALDGDRLKLALGTEGRARPKDFTAVSLKPGAPLTADSPVHVNVLTLRREPK